MTDAERDRERRRGSLRTQRICRFCLSRSEPLSDIYRDATRGPVPLPLQVMACVAIEVFPSDSMPTTICNLCRHFMDQSYRFKQICKQGDEALRQYITQGDLRKPIEWPADILKYLPENLMSGKGDISCDFLELDKKSEKVHKIPGQRGRPRKNPLSYPSRGKVDQKEIKVHIETDGEKEPPTKIRVTQCGDDLVISTSDVDQLENNPEEDSTSIHASIISSDVPTGVFSCPHCERSYPLSQLRDIHVQTHLRERAHHCKECTSSFYNKYDLQKHEVTHFGEKAFHCPVCQKSFHRLSLLRRHEKLHKGAPKYICTECDQTFLSQDILALHFKNRHERKREFACQMCPKKFVFKQGLDRHFAQHQLPNFKCNYCDLHFGSNKQLIRHVQSHAGVRPYPCKFCPKSFILSHHYTRHLRTSHLNRTNLTEKGIKKEGPFTSQENFKCMECNASFTKQDDLIYHSAIHATQNLICPICKEQFPNVDAVTTHIKSHLKGEQFACEWCELIFTSEEKLDMHIDTEHQDSMNADDTLNEITFLEGKLIDESEVPELHESSEDSYDEEDELYDSTQQSEAQKLNSIEEKEGKEIEVEVDPDGQLKIVNAEIEFEDESSKIIETSEVIDNVNKLTYTELKTVDPDFITPEVVAPVLSKSILTKAEEVKKKMINKLIVQKSVDKVDTVEPKIVPAVVQKSEENPSPKTSPIVQKMVERKEKPSFSDRLSKKNSLMDIPPKEPVKEPSRTNEKSLQLLEKDLLELKKVAAGGSPERMSSGRFPTYKPLPFRKESNTNNGKGVYKPLISRKFTSDTNENNSTERGHKKMITSTPIVPSKHKYESANDDASDDDFMSENDNSENDTTIRRSARPSKVKDYAALVRDQDDESVDTGSEYELDEDEKEEKDDYDEKEFNIKPAKPPPPTTTADGTVVKRKRGRPRKNPIDPKKITEMSPVELKKVLKRPVGRPSKKAMQERAALLGTTVEELKKKPELSKSVLVKKKQSTSTAAEESRPILTPIKSSSGLTKVSADMVKILPPGVKPLPLPPEAGAPPGVCQMKIGEKVVRVQKIVMSKAEVEAITKRGLIEMKDGAMVLKAGVKLPAAGDSKLIKSSLLNETLSKSQDISSPGPSSSALLSSTSTSHTKVAEVAKPTRFGRNSPSDDEMD